MRACSRCTGAVPPSSAHAMAGGTADRRQQEAALLRMPFPEGLLLWRQHTRATPHLCKNKLCPTPLQKKASAPHLCPRELVLLLQHLVQRPVVEAVDVAQAALPREHLARVPEEGQRQRTKGHEIGCTGCTARGVRDWLHCHWSGRQARWLVGSGNAGNAEIGVGAACRAGRRQKPKPARPQGWHPPSRGGHGAGHVVQQLNHLQAGRQVGQMQVGQIQVMQANLGPAGGVQEGSANTADVGRQGARSPVQASICTCATWPSSACNRLPEDHHHRPAQTTVPNSVHRL